MTESVLASKKNVIVAVVTLLAVALMVGSYFTKKSRIQKQIELGGQVEVSFDRVPNPGEYGMIRQGSERFSLVNDMATSVLVAGQPFAINLRAIDSNYPLVGKFDIDRKQFKMALIHDARTKTYGVVVNEFFLEQSGLKFGDKFTAGGNNYHIRAMIKSIPDLAGQQMNEKPFVLLRHEALRGSEFFKIASKKTLRYRILNQKLSPADWEKLYRQKLPKSNAIITRWDA